LVRVTRRVEWGAHRPTPGARWCRGTPLGACCRPRLNPWTSDSVVHVGISGLLCCRVNSRQRFIYQLFFPGCSFVFPIRMVSSLFRRWRPPGRGKVFSCSTIENLPWVFSSSSFSLVKQQWCIWNQNTQVFALLNADVIEYRLLLS